MSLEFLFRRALKGGKVYSSSYPGPKVHAIIVVACTHRSFYNNSRRYFFPDHEKTFLSSTYIDLKDFRKAAIEILDREHHAVAMEQFFALNQLRQISFSNIGTFVIELLEKAYLVSEDCYRNCGSSLFSCAVSGLREGTPGEPKAHDVNIRDKSKDALSDLQPGSPAYRF